jgi:hypothetical protein
MLNIQNSSSIYLYSNHMMFTRHVKPMVKISAGFHDDSYIKYQKQLI